MCYLCGPDKVAKTINEALAVWKRKLVPEGERANYQGDYAYRHSWGYRHDWTKPPAKPPRLPECIDMARDGSGPVWEAS